MKNKIYWHAKLFLKALDDDDDDGNYDMRDHDDDNDDDGGGEDDNENDDDDFVWVDSLHPSQQFFIYVGTGLPGLTQS